MRHNASFGNHKSEPSIKSAKAASLSLVSEELYFWWSAWNLALVVGLYSGLVYG